MLNNPALAPEGVITPSVKNIDQIDAYLEWQLPVTRHPLDNEYLV
jgi:hypothetical protein